MKVNIDWDLSDTEENEKMKNWYGRAWEEELNEEGLKRATDMISEGYSSGELIYENGYEENDEEINVEFRGFWSVEK